MQQAARPKYAQAREMHEQSKAMAEETGNREGVAKACGNLRDCYRSMGDYVRAREMFEQYKTMAEELVNNAGPMLSLLLKLICPVLLIRA